MTLGLLYCSIVLAPRWPSYPVIFYQEKPFGELLSMTSVKLPKDVKFLRNLAKRQIPRSRQKRL